MADDLVQVAATAVKLRTWHLIILSRRGRLWQLDNADESAELHRLVELSYAAEQAGFILDGTILRNGGRIWDVQPVFASEGGREQGNAAQPDATATPSSTSSISGADSAVEPPTEADASVDREATTRTEAKGGAGTGLRANLRKLSNL